MSNPFDEFRGFAAYIAGVVGVATLPPAIWNGNPYATTIAAVALTYATTAVALSRTAPHGRGRTFRSRARRALAWLTVAPLKPCGCFDADADTVETETFVRRTDADALVRLEARERRLRRCHACGRHYHDETDAKFRDVAAHGRLKDLAERRNHGHVRRVDIWPEDEPEARDAISAPIEREGS